MKERCDNPRAKAYDRYGGRGITYTPEWATFPNFLRDMGERPSSQHTLDRIDNDKGYSPENCRWATKRQQIENRRCTRTLTYRGETYSLRTWCEKTGLSWSCVAARVQKGWTAEQIIETPWLPRDKRRWA